MAQVAIQLSPETLERVRTHAEANETSAEQVIADAVEGMFAPHDPLLGFATEEDYQAWVQEGIDSAENEPLVDAEVVFAEMRERLADLLAKPSR